jgi:hypothetical protein
MIAGSRIKAWRSTHPLKLGMMLSCKEGRKEGFRQLHHEARRFAAFMSNLPNQILFTYEDYLSLDSLERYELIEGQLYAMSSPSTSHQWAVGSLTTQLRVFLKGKNQSLIACLILLLLFRPCRKTIRQTRKEIPATESRFGPIGMELPLRM